MSKFNIGDVVQCTDSSSKYFLCCGEVTDTIVGMCRVRLNTTKTEVAFHNNQLVLNKAAKRPNLGFDVGDRVMHHSGKTGTVVKVIIDMSISVIDLEVDCDDGHLRIWNSSNVTIIGANPKMPSHYQAVVDKDGPNYDSHSDQDIGQREKENQNPFEHTDLGSDLSGDELMESIRSICGR